MSEARLQPADAFWQRPLVMITFSIFLIGVFFIYDHSLTYTVGEAANTDRDAADAVAEGSLARKAKLVVLGLAAAMSLLAPGNCRLTMRSPLTWLCLAFVLWCAASIAWAADPSIVARRVAAFFCLFLAGFAAARRLPVRTLPAICLVVTSVFLCTGVVAELSLGTFRPWVSWYRFSGTCHPNTQGQLCAVLCLAAAAMALAGRKRLLLLVVCAMAVVFVLWTRSRTSFASLLIALTGLLFFAARPRTKVCLASGALFIASLGLLTLGPLLTSSVQQAILLNRTESDLTTLTGRVPLWDDLLGYATEQPWLGYGFGGFWTANHVAALSSHWDITSAHSAYFEMLLGVGFLGLALYAMVLIWGLARNVHKYGIESSAGYSFASAVILFFLCHGLLESAVTLPKLTAFYLWWAVCLGLRTDERPMPQIEESGVMPQAAARYTAHSPRYRWTTRWSPEDGRT